MTKNDGLRYLAHRPIDSSNSFRFSLHLSECRRKKKNHSNSWYWFGIAAHRIDIGVLNFSSDHKICLSTIRGPVGTAYQVPEARKPTKKKELIPKWLLFPVCHWVLSQSASMHCSMHLHLLHSSHANDIARCSHHHWSFYECDSRASVPWIFFFFSIFIVPHRPGIAYLPLCSFWNFRFISLGPILTKPPSAIREYLCTTRNEIKQNINEQNEKLKLP